MRCVEGWIMSGLNGLGPAMRIGDRSCNGTAKHFNDRQRRTSRCPQRMTQRVTGSIPVRTRQKTQRNQRDSRRRQTRPSAKHLGALRENALRPFFCRRSMRASQARSGPSALPMPPDAQSRAGEGAGRRQGSAVAADLTLR